MNNQEAKLILQAYRPDGQDAANPQFRDALEQARLDPDLGRWFAAEQALDARLSARLKQSLTPPAQLKAQLLAQQKLIRQSVWWQRPATRLAMAAGLTILLTIGAVWYASTRPAGFARYQVAMAEFTEHKLDRLDLMSRDVAELRRWLATQDAHSDLVLPAGLAGRPSLGCRVLEWKGHKVSLICFELENRREAHLLVIERAAFRDGPSEAPVFNQVGAMATLSWSRGDKTYLLASTGGRQADLMQLL